MLTGILDTKKWQRKIYIHTERLKNRVLSPVVSVHPNPVFILGNQKSGTTAIAALLAHLTGKSVTLDIEPLWRSPDLALFRREKPFSEFVKKNRYMFSREIIKEPWLTFFYDELNNVFPQAKYVFIVREPRNNIRSILNRLGLPGNLDKLPHELFERLEPRWQIVLMGDLLDIPDNHYISVLAYRWVRAVQVYLEHKDAMSLVRYEVFESDKEKAIQQLADRLALPPKQSIASLLNKPFQPPGNRRMPLEQFFGKKNLERIKEICGDYMKLFDYSW